MNAKGQTPVIENSQQRPVFTNIIKPPRLIGPENQALKTKDVVVEIFSGFDCADCRDFAFDVLPLLQEKYGKSEHIKVVYYTVPDEENDDHYRALVGLKCAEEKGKFKEMHADLQLNPATGREADLMAQELGLDLYEYRACVKSGRYDEEIQTLMDYAKERGIRKKPTILIDDYVLFGNQPIENINKIISEVTR